MITLSFVFLVLHLLGLALGVGGATVKLFLILKCNRHPDLFTDYFKLIKPITTLIITGLVLLTVSGAGWTIMGYPFTALFIVKLILVGMIWAIGPIIDNVYEPRLQHHLADTGEPVSVLAHAGKQYLVMEVLATGLMYVVTIIGVLL